MHTLAAPATSTVLLAKLIRQVLAPRWMIQMLEALTCPTTTVTN